MLLNFRGLGGDLMELQGVTLLKHYRETAFMGFWEVIRNLQKILGYIELCKKDILDWKPDALILVDYPGFNLRIAEFAKKNDFKVFYYISPGMGLEGIPCKEDQARCGCNVCDPAF
jgi:lipid-A-disaccharide synthase